MVRFASRLRRAALVAPVFTLVVAMVVVVPMPQLTARRAMQVETLVARFHAASGGSGPVQASAPDVGDFRAIGVTWGDQPPASLRLRLHSDGAWGPWTDVPTHNDDAPDRQSPEFHADRQGSAPMWVGHADGYQLEAPPGVGDLAVNVVRENGPVLRLRDSTAFAAADNARPPMAGRSAWQARDPKVPPSYASNVHMAFVHHTVNANDYAAADVPAILRAIQTYHMDTNGWDDIGYNFVVDRFGTIWEGRAGGVERAVIGAHAEGFNKNSTGAAVLGTFTDTPPPSAALRAMGQLLGWKLPWHGVDPTCTAQMRSNGNDSYPEGTIVTMNAVSGHRDAKPTGCPGAQLYDKLGQIRSAAASFDSNFPAYSCFRGGVYVAAGQLDGDDADEIITGADSGGGSHVRTFEANGKPRGNGFFVYPEGFTGGVRLATGNVDGLVGDEVITGAGPGGGPHVRAMKENGTDTASFFAYHPEFHSGVYVASGNVDGVPGDEIITGPGPGGGPHVAVWTGKGVLLSSFYAYNPIFSSGVTVAAADINGDGIDEIITGAGPSGGPHVQAFNLAGLSLASFYAYDPNFSAGVNVGAVRRGEAGDLIATGPFKGGGPHVRLFSAKVGVSVVNEFMAGSPDILSGARVAGGKFLGTAPDNLAITFGNTGPAVVRETKIDGTPITPP